MDEPWNFFEDILPPEVTMLVFSHLSIEDVVYVSLVCKIWNTYFDTKQIWKQIFELNFGAVGEKSVDLTQNLRWKRLFFKACNTAQWKKDFVRASTTFTCRHFPHQGAVTSHDGLTENGRYHVVLANGIFVLTDIKMAAKIVPMKHNPVTLSSWTIFNFHLGQVSFKSLYSQHHDTKAPKDNEFVMKNNINGQAYYYQGTNGGTNGKDTFSFVRNSDVLLFNVETHALNPEKNMTALYFRNLPNPYYHKPSFNSKFLAAVSQINRDYSAIIVDLSKTCWHCCKLRHKDGYFAPEFNAHCSDCALTTLQGEYRQVFVSQLNQNKIVLFAFHDVILIWTYGEGTKEIKFKKTGNAQHMSEHVVEMNGVKRHWFTFTSDVKYFVDLNNLHERVFVPAVSLSKWVPKKSKIALVSGTKLIVYDLERKAWCSKLTVSEPISAIDFNRTGNVLFMATQTHVHAYLWEAALLLDSFSHEIPQPIIHLHFALDQVLVLSTRDTSFYKRIKTKLDV